MEQPPEHESDRDRDVAGRARNARPRDSLGRPLARRAHGVGPINEERVRSSADTLQEAQYLLEVGRPFQAHEVLELRWKRCSPGEQDLWQALAQLAVAVTHTMRENYTGARSLLRRSQTGLTRYQGPVPTGLDLADLLEWIEDAVTEVEENPTTVRQWLSGHVAPLALGGDRHSRRT